MHPYSFACVEISVRFSVVTWAKKVGRASIFFTPFTTLFWPKNLIKWENSFLNCFHDPILFTFLGVLDAIKCHNLQVFHLKLHLLRYVRYLTVYSITLHFILAKNLMKKASKRKKTVSATERERNFKGWNCISVFSPFFRASVRTKKLEFRPDFLRENIKNNRTQSEMKLISKYKTILKHAWYPILLSNLRLIKFPPFSFRLGNCVSEQKNSWTCKKKETSEEEEASDHEKRNYCPDLLRNLGSSANI